MDEVKVTTHIVRPGVRQTIGNRTQAQDKRRMARGGKLISHDYLRLVNGEKAALVE